MIPSYQAELNFLLMNSTRRKANRKRIEELREILAEIEEETWWKNRLPCKETLTFDGERSVQYTGNE